MQALLLLRQSHMQNLLSDVGLSLNGDLFRLGTAKDALFEGATTDEIAFTLNFKNGTIAKWVFAYQRPDENVVPIKEHVQDSEIVGLFDDNFNYLQAERIGPRAAFPVSDFHVRQHHQLGARGEYTVHYLYEFGANTVAQSLQHPLATTSALKDQVEAWMGEISPGFRLELTTHPGIDVMSPSVQFVSEKLTSRPFRATSVGFGIFYSLPVVTALLSATPGSLLLIENPEAHLHPKGQSKVGELIAKVANAGVQVLIETHSDHVLNGIRIAVRHSSIDREKVALHFFQRKMKGGQPRTDIVSPKVLKDGRLDIWPDGFFDEWDKSLEILLDPLAQNEL